MRNLPTLFFATAVLFALCGMAWGIQMSISDDHLMAPAHAHLNLIGFVLMSVFGTFYALSPAAAASPIARVHFGLVVATVVIMVPGIYLAISEQGETLAKIGSLLAVASMVVFGWVVVRFGVGAGAHP